MKRFLALGVILCLITATTVQAKEMSVSEEIEIGKEAFSEVKAHLPLVDDPDVLSYVRNLGNRLAKARPDDRYTYRFFVADQGIVNAFALPGGWMVFYRGLITSMEKEGELAGVMAHEMSHVYYRHIAARVQKSGAVNMATMAGMVAGLLLGALGGSPELGQALTLGSAAGGAQAQLAFSRDDEMQADYGAYKVLSAAGYPPKDMERTFHRMWRNQRTTSPTPPTYLLTHPTSPQRMEAVQNLVRRHPDKSPKYNNNDFLRIRARLIALYDPIDEAPKKLEANLRKNPKSIYPLYGLALYEMRSSHYKKALNRLNSLEKKWKDSSYLLRAKGICLLHLGNYNEAEILLDKCLAEKPNDQEAQLALGQTYLRQNKLEDAAYVLGRVIADHPDDSQAHYDLGVALGRLGKKAQASLHLGLAFKQGGRIKTARYHLERAVNGLSDQPELLSQAQKALEEIQGPKEKDKKSKDKEKTKKK